MARTDRTKIYWGVYTGTSRIGIIELYICGVLNSDINGIYIERRQKMKRLFERLMILIVLFPACFWWLLHTATRNKTEKKFLSGFILWLAIQFKGINPNQKARIYP